MHVQYCKFRKIPEIPGIGLISRSNSQWKFPKFRASEFPRGNPRSLPPAARGGRRPLAAVGGLLVVHPRDIDIDIDIDIR